MLSPGANVIIWCYHVMLSSGMITPLFFIFPENFTHSSPEAIRVTSNNIWLNVAQRMLESSQIWYLIHSWVLHQSSMTGASGLAEGCRYRYSAILMSSLYKNTLTRVRVQQFQQVLWVAKFNFRSFLQKSVFRFLVVNSLPICLGSFKVCFL
jgi:hypothetical protein